MLLAFSSDPSSAGLCSSVRVERDVSMGRLTWTNTAKLIPASSKKLLADSCLPFKKCYRCLITLNCLFSGDSEQFLNLQYRVFLNFLT